MPPYNGAETQNDGIKDRFWSAGMLTSYIIWKYVSMNDKEKDL